jgi:phage gpG-like protein
MAIVTIKITGDQEAIGKLQKLGKSLIMFRSAMNEIGGELSDYFSQQVFASQGGAIGERWPRLSPAYQARKAKFYPGRGPLQRTGEMQKGFYHTSDEQSVTIKNRKKYFDYHQSTEPRSKIPRRPMMATTGEVKDIVARVLQADVTAKIRKAGL